MEQILPAKANKQDMNHALALKANLHDIKSTMAEVAANIESKVSMEEFRVVMEEKVARSELSLRMQEKVSFEDMKRYVSLNGGGGAQDGAQATGSVGGPARQLEMIEEELRSLKEKTEDTFH